ncbi:MAG: DUF1697 domain-containing protein [Patescibacteria group bacterium]|nr:DUF1697 domain-containing protein [Patescibacteria group bacterium]
MKHTYVAFLRGINVGGNTKISMAILKKTMQEARFDNVQTVLNSGNIVFASSQAAKEAKKTIESLIEKTFGFHCEVLIRQGQELQKLVAEDPFQHGVQDPQVRCHVTFFSSSPPVHTAIASDSHVTIVPSTGNEVCWKVFLSDSFGTTEAMNILEKNYGKNITTRTWKTILKIVQLLS